MLTRQDLTDEQYVPIRNTPHYVLMAVSAAGGSLFDEIKERRAGLHRIVEGLKGVHPLVREIAGADDIVIAEDQLQAWWHGLDDKDRHRGTMRARAMESFNQALATLRSRGDADDVHHYCVFVLGLARHVAETAREGDVLGIGGEQVSEGERDFIAALEHSARDAGY